MIGGILKIAQHDATRDSDTTGEHSCAGSSVVGLLPISCAASNGNALCGDFGSDVQQQFMVIGGVSSLQGWPLGRPKDLIFGFFGGGVPKDDPNIWVLLWGVPPKYLGKF